MDSGVGLGVVDTEAFCHQEYEIYFQIVVIVAVVVAAAAAAVAGIDAFGLVPHLHIFLGILLCC